MGEPKEREGWKSIKIRESTYEELKKMGEGISKAVEILVEDKKSRIKRKIQDVKNISNDIAQILLEHGVFDIRFTGAGIQSVREDGDVVNITGVVGLRIPNSEARNKIVQVLTGEEE